MSVIYFILIMGLTVAIHEFGHLVTAKMFNVYCHEYSIGMGPKIFSKKGKETEYSLRAFPLGGYVKMAGEEELEEDTEIPRERQLSGLKPGKRIVVMLAGICMNVVLALILFSSLFLMIGSYPEYPDTTIASVSAGMPAEAAGLAAGDKITKMTFENGVTVYPVTFDEIGNYVQIYHGKVTCEVQRGETTFEAVIDPIYDAEANRYYLGVTMGDIIRKEVKWYNAPLYGFKYSVSMMKDIYTSLRNLVMGRGLEQLSGPIGIYQATDDVMSQATSFKEGLLYFINIWALISLNVGIFNLLPIPLFDGGRVVLTLAEIILGRPVDKRLENILMYGSLILVFLLFAFVMYNDISKLIH